MKPYLIIMLALMTVLTACGPEQEEVISLSNLSPLPVVAAAEITPLRVAVAAVISPQGTVESYQPLLDHIHEELGRPVELVQRRTYAEVNELIASGEVDLAFVCTSAYVRGHDAFGMELVAVPEVAHQAVYHSLLIVPSDSDAQSMADLRGKVFAFTDPMSNTGRIYPTSLVLELGSTPEEFFRRTFFTYSHDDAIEAVAARVADGAAVDSLVYDFAVMRDPSLAERVRVIHQSPSFAAPPVVVGPGVRPQVRAQIAELLFGLTDTEEGQQVLAALGVDRFVALDDSAYDSLRTLMRQVGSWDAGEN